MSSISVLVLAALLVPEPTRDVRTVDRRPALCSIMMFGSARRHKDSHTFVARAAADTIAVTTGELITRSGLARAGIHGQVARVESVVGPALAGLTTGSSVVLVPWSFSPSCAPDRWDRGWRWLEPGSRGLFSSELRPRADWVNGMPTFDIAAAGLQPYREPPAASAAVALTVDQLFTLTSLLPTYDATSYPNEASFERVLAWARANPSLARLDPASTIVRDAAREIRRNRLGQIRTELAGTYRLTVHLGPGDTLVLYARTDSIPSGEFERERNRRPASDPTTIAPIEGYYLYVTMARSLGLFPRERKADRDMSLEGNWAVLTAADRRPDGKKVLTGELEFDMIAAVFPRNQLLQRMKKAEDDRSVQGMLQSTPYETRASFVILPSGDVEVEQRVDRDGSPVLIRGTRISRGTM